jgi:predicted Rossmann fold flavoprotein
MFTRHQQGDGMRRFRLEQMKICIIGAGPAGLMASIHCALANADTAVFETNTTAGRKLLLTGGGRCNLTHLADPDEIVRAFGPKGRFLSYALHCFTPEHTRQFFSELGLDSIVEPNGCVFPASDRAIDVRDCLINHARNLGVRSFFDKSVKRITREGNSFVIHTSRDSFVAEKVIIATGGLSYSQTGSTGDGYRFARELGHTIIELKASLVPLVTREDWPEQIAGTAVENVKACACINNKKITTTGPLVFTDDGVGGLAAWDMSRHLTDHLPALEKPLEITIDLAPQVTEVELGTQLTALITATPKKKVVNILMEFVPKRLAEVSCKLTGCDEKIKANQLKKDVRKKLISKLKALPLSIINTRPIAEAIVTRGGVNTCEIESKTMESKICPGLFFAGEVIDADGPCGGYSLQMCWSTGALAGTSATKKRP